jgi:hypothetical protein
VKGTPTGPALLATIWLSLAACGGSAAKPTLAAPTPAEIVPPASDPGASLPVPLQDPLDLTRLSLYLRVTMARLKAHPNQDAATQQDLVETTTRAYRMLEQVRTTWVTRTVIRASDTESGQSYGPLGTFMTTVMKPGMRKLDAAHCAESLIQALTLVTSLEQATVADRSIVAEQQASFRSWSGHLSEIAEEARAVGTP